MGDAPACWKGHQEIGDALHLWDGNFIRNVGVCVLFEPLAQVRGKIPLCFSMRWTFGVGLIVTRAATGMREMMLAHKPGLDDHRSLTQLTEAFARCERRSWVLNRGDVDPLSRCFPYGNEWHRSCSPLHEAARSPLSQFFCAGGQHCTYRHIQLPTHRLILINPEKSGNACPNTLEGLRYYGISEEIGPGKEGNGMASQLV